MDKIDFKKDYKDLFQPSKNKISVVNVPAMNFIMADGEGNPNTSDAFQNAVEALYSVSYSIKFMLKRNTAAEVQQIKDYIVPPLEGLWWSNNMNDFILGNKDEWKWTLMIMQPVFVTVEIFKDALNEVARKKNLVALSKLRFENFNEGSAVQLMHIGPYSEEAKAIERLHDFIKDNGFLISGKHHEIYLSDPRKANPLKMKTILRQPFKSF